MSQPDPSSPPPPPAPSTDPMLICPTCGNRMKETRCKLVCKTCGFFLSCSDFY